MTNLRRIETAILLAASLMAGCGQRIAFDLQPKFEKLVTGDSIAAASAKLELTLDKPATDRDVLGFRYVEYRLVDARASYALTFVGMPLCEPVLVQKKAAEHLQ
jgi:hypothetical protein